MALYRPMALKMAVRSLGVGNVLGTNVIGEGGLVGEGVG